MDVILITVLNVIQSIQNAKNVQANIFTIQILEIVNFVKLITAQFVFGQILILKLLNIVQSVLNISI